jgi:sialate O-acetylesterase
VKRKNEYIRFRILMRKAMKKLTKKLILFLLLSLVIIMPSVSQIRLPKLIGDGMVLQRNTTLKIWGWAAPKEKITINFGDIIRETISNDQGEWEVKLSNLNAGGPYTMTISGSNSITLKDILVGDVWVCSGQSNMELNMKRASPIYGPEIKSAENNYIRYFAVPQTYNFKEPQNDYKSGNWQTANPNTVLNFGAIGYFFARELYQKYLVPIGIINTAIGGTPVEAWMSEEAIKAFPVYYKEAQKFKDDALISQIEQQDREKSQAWYTELGQKDEGYKDPQKKWSDQATNTDGWATMKIPGYWVNTGLGAVNGVVWFKKEIDVPVSMVGQPALLKLGRIVDADSAFINGVFVGTTSYQYPPRRYEIKTNLLKTGKNILIVRVINNSGIGGFVLDKPYQLVVNDQTIDLQGDWQYRLGAIMKPLAGQTFVKYKPTGLYNAMISPLLNFSMKGVLWYQGESNAERPVEYRQLFPALIQDWRNNWKQGDFPFLFVQLPNFMEPKPAPSESNWALLREAQLKTLSLPNTGMAVAIDIGEWNDIHPLNKLDVAKRLALAAQKVAYGDSKVIYSGPIYQTMNIKGNKAILSFDHIGNGLIAKGNKPLNQFAIAGIDKKFVWATARIKNNKVVVWNDKIQNPVAVRYAWADNPEGANLYNKEGLPASPFRTDE